MARLVDELGVETRVDLRSQKEAAEATSAAFDAVAVEHLEVHAGEARWDFDSAHQREWVAGHYLRFTEGEWFLKGGTDSPENLLGYAGFDDTWDALHPEPVSITRIAWVAL